MGKTTEMVEVTTKMLKPYERNAKIHGAEQIEKLKNSIHEFGFLNPCLIDKDYNIIAGHGRVMAAKELGMEKVPCVFIEGLTDEQRRAYILADNRLGELGEWDMEIVSAELERIKSDGLDIDLTGFDIDDIIIDEDMSAQFVEDDMRKYLSETPPRVKEQQIWQLGRHRLMCGDSTKAEDVSRLMGKDKADLLLTDPPYNIALGYGDSPEIAKKKHRRTDGVFLKNDAMDEESFNEFLTKAFTNGANHMKQGASYYCWYASTSQVSTQQALEKADLPPHQILIWVKQSLSLGRQDYQWRHEPCFYGWKEGGAHYFIDVRSFTTVFDNVDNLTKEEAIKQLKELSSVTTAIYENKPSRSQEHPTMKPLNLIKRLIRNSSREDDKVMDLFGGSGTTLLACEEMDRQCYMMECEPHFCDVIINRWEEETGREATLIDG